MSTFRYHDFLKTFTEFERKFAPDNLFVEGDPTLLQSGLKVCIVGSRKMSEEGLEDAQCLARTLVSHEAIVVSGLAEGIDSVGHETAINYGGKTIAVLGHPLNTVYPKKNSRLLDIIKRDHLAVTQFPIGYPIKKENFPMRNRTMALLSDATI